MYILHGNIISHPFFFPFCIYLYLVLFLERKFLPNIMYGNVFLIYYTTLYFKFKINSFLNI